LPKGAGGRGKEIAGKTETSDTKRILMI
jgi:hypothetical protein